MRERPKRLTDAFCRTVKVAGRYSDGGRGSLGLALIVKERIGGGWAKSWSQRIRVNGRQVHLGLGSYPVVGLAMARERALRNAREAVEGRDPRADTRVPTFEQAAERVIALHAPTWKEGRGSTSVSVWRSSLRRYAYPTLGNKRVHQITAADVLGVVTPIWHTKNETARRLKGRISSIMRWAIAEGHRADDPAGVAVAAALPRAGNGPQKHLPALPHQEVGAALTRVRESGASAASRLAFTFQVLTAARSGEIREARWTEVDLEARVWIVPAERMKAKREHRVPLSSVAMRVLGEAAMIRDHTGLLFPSPTGRGPLSNNTLLKLLRELGIAAVPHGFRSSFRSWAAEIGTPREIAETCLAHTNKNRVEAAYQRSDLLQRRRELMEQWGMYITVPRSP